MHQDRSASRKDCSIRAASSAGREERFANSQDACAPGGIFVAISSASFIAESSGAPARATPEIPNEAKKNKMARKKSVEGLEAMIKLPRPASRILTRDIPESPRHKKSIAQRLWRAGRRRREFA